MAEAFAIELSSVGFAYRPEQWVFRGCSAAIPRNHVVALLGPNGRGKTTLLKILLNSLRPTEGSVTVNGRVAFVPQLFETSFDYRTLDIVLMGRARNIGLFSQPSNDDKKRAVSALEQFGLEACASKPFHELSGGQRQLALFARALVSDAEILILDEPTASLDLKNQALVLQTIRRLTLTDGLTIVFSTHQPNHALAFADEALMMAENTEHLFGPVLDVLGEPQLTRIFDIPIRRFKVEGLPAPTVVPVLRPSDG